MTAEPGIFAGGDCVTGHGTVVAAVGAGQAAAVEIDRYLGGKGELPANSDPLVANLRPTGRRASRATRAPSAARRGRQAGEGQLGGDGLLRAACRHLPRRSAACAATWKNTLTKGLIPCPTAPS